jgi:hypothetical protein
MKMNGTVFDAIVASLEKAAAYNPNDQAAPAVVLWTDHDRQWEPLTARISARLPQLLALGPYDPQSKTGPAIWLRAMIARKLPEADWPAEAVPIVYLPGISRQQLRAVEECAKDLQPLAELQYRGVFWTQVSAKDWTLCAMLKSEQGGLGLEVARDSDSQQALRRCLLRLVEEPVERLRGRRLDAAFFNSLLTPDPIRDLLDWLNSPEVTQKRCDAETWTAFCIVCRKTYQFDPVKEGPLVGAEKLGHRDGPWQAVWNRFAEAPTLYPGIPDWLERARPAKVVASLFSEEREPWPQENAALEDDLRKKLTILADKLPADARKTVQSLEESHGRRRQWVWAKLGRAPLAGALAHLAILAQSTQKAIAGATLDAMAENYSAEGWRCDAAVLESLACAERADDVTAVSRAVAALYQPWLSEGAKQFQKLAVTGYPAPQIPAEIPAGCCVLFADGLRYDIGQNLGAEIEKRGWPLESSWGWVRLPSVTATCKPAVSPVAGLLGGAVDEDQFRPQISADGKVLTQDRFRKLLQDNGVQYLDQDETGDTAGRGWTECGSIDHTGHKDGLRLARRIAEEVRALVDRIRALLEAGWKEIRVVTDHGWLLVPGGLPKVAMPAYLTETRWGRCAVVREGAHVEVPMVPWGWCGELHIAVAPGIGAFRNGLEYDHGGLSLQECLVPRLTVRPVAAVQAGKIESVVWRGLRCRIETSGVTPDWKLDLRTSPNDPTSLAGGAQPVDANGHASLLVENDDYLGKPAVLVLVSPAGQVTNKRLTLIGGED